MVGDRHRRLAVVGGGLDDFLDPGGAVEHRELAVHVEMHEALRRHRRRSSRPENYTAVSLVQHNTLGRAVPHVYRVAGPGGAAPRSTPGTAPVLARGLRPIRALTGTSVPLPARPRSARGRPG